MALDPNGQPVKDLRASDLRVLDNGKPHQVMFLRPNYVQRRAAIQLGLRGYSNRASPAHPPATLILFGLMNERVMVDACSRNEIIYALEDLESSESLCLIF